LFHNGTDKISSFFNLTSGLVLGEYYTKLYNDQIVERIATSTHIELINPELIDSVKILRTYELIKEPKSSNPGKALFTIDEIFNQFDSEDIRGNVFHQTEQDILNILAEKSNARNQKQIDYLSLKRQSEKYKLRYTLKPNFGYLFYIEGVQHNHFVWELINSNATYIWSFKKDERDIEMQYSRIESIVNNIRTKGREKYKKTYNDENQDNDIIFKPISHEEIDSKSKDGFLIWKNKLNEQLI
jgi:hypothetical protein